MFYAVIFNKGLQHGKANYLWYVRSSSKQHRNTMPKLWGKNKTLNEADAGKNDVVFLASGEDAFIKKLKTSKKVIIEAPFFQEPRTQFDFDIAGLEWKH